MIIKLVIISVIFIGGGILLFPESRNLLPINFDETKEDFSNLKDDTLTKVEDTVDDTSDKVEATIDDTLDKAESSLEDIYSKTIIPAQGLIQHEPIYTGQVFDKNEDGKTCLVSVPDMAKIIEGKKELTHIISIDNCEFDVNDSVQISGGGGGSFSSEFNFPLKPKSNDKPKPIIVESTPPSLIFDTLSLSTIREETNDVMIQYHDTSGKTKSVSVTLRNAERELFTGVFFASKFDTSVNDISDTPHIVKMEVEHTDHGTITSSVFNPAGKFDTKISGVFVKN